MANFSASTLATAQAIFTAQMQQAEFRLPDVAALRVANLSAPTNPSVADLRTAPERPVKAYMPIRKPDATGGTTRNANHTGAQGDSMEVDIVWATFSEPFSVSLKRGNGNVIKFQDEYASGRRTAILNLLSRINSWFVAQMVAKKTHVNAGGGNGAYDGTTTFDYIVPKAEKDYFFQNAKATLEYNLYSGQMVGLVDDRAKLLFDRQFAQGGGNSQNLNFQFLNTEVVGSTQQILSGYDVSGLFFQNGFVSLIPWIPLENRKPLNPQLGLSYNGDYGSFSIPELGGINFASHVYASRQDMSGNGGDTQDLLIQEEVSVDIGIVVAPLSNAGETPILSVGLATS